MSHLTKIRSDRLAQEPLVQAIENPVTTFYSNDENDIIVQGLHNFKNFRVVSNKAKNIRTASPLTIAKVMQLPRDNMIWGYSSTIIRATPAQIAAALFHETSHENTADNDVERIILDETNEHSHLVYVRKTNGFGIRDRDYVYRTVWKKVDSNTFVVAYSPALSKDRPPVADAVRASTILTVKLSGLNETETKIERVFRIGMSEDNLCV